MWHSILLGSALIVVTVAIHAFGTTWWIRRLKERYAASKNPTFNDILNVLAKTAVLLLFLHILEILVWAFSYELFTGLKELNTFEEAMYFSTVTFTTLGYGDVVIENDWRLLSGIQAIAGHLIFGWSTALLIAVVQKLWATTADEEHQVKKDS